MRQRERVRRRPGRHQKHRDLVLEDFGEALFDPPGPVVPAVGQRGAFVRAGDRRENFRRDARRVVACKVHAALDPRDVR